MQQKVSRSPWKTDFCSSIPWGRLCCRFFLVCWNLLLFSPKLTVNVMTCLKMCLPFSCFIHPPNYVSLKFDHVLSKSVSLFSTLGPEFCCCYVCLFVSLFYCRMWQIVFPLVGKLCHRKRFWSYGLCMKK